MIGKRFGHCLPFQTPGVFKTPDVFWRLGLISPIHLKWVRIATCHPPDTVFMEILIDLKQAPLNLDRAELEAYSLQLKDELEEVADDVALVREAIAPENAMAGEAGFDLGILKAEVNFENLKKVLDWLGNIFYGRILEVEYEEDGRKVVLNYRTDA
jgi:hypothetical protein